VAERLSKPEFSLAGSIEKLLGIIQKPLGIVEKVSLEAISSLES
jgi:hypothetical protein